MALPTSDTNGASDDARARMLVAESAIDLATSRARQRFGKIDLLINNAGVMVADPLEIQTLEDFEWLFGINFWGVVYGCKFFLPHLRRAVWNNIVALEAQLDALQLRPTNVAVDLDFDGKNEFITHTPALQLAIRDDGLAAAHELSSYPLCHNFGDTLRLTSLATTSSSQPWSGLPPARRANSTLRRSTAAL